MVWLGSPPVGGCVESVGVVVVVGRVVDVVGSVVVVVVVVVSMIVVVVGPTVVVVDVVVSTWVVVVTGIDVVVVGPVVVVGSVVVVVVVVGLVVVVVDVVVVLVVVVVGVEVVVVTGTVVVVVVVTGIVVVVLVDGAVVVVVSTMRLHNLAATTGSGNVTDRADTSTDFEPVRPVAVSQVAAITGKLPYVYDVAGGSKVRLKPAYVPAGHGGAAAWADPANDSKAVATVVVIRRTVLFMVWSPDVGIRMLGLCRG